MTIDTKIENGRGTLVPHGSIDSTTADQLDAAASAMDLATLEGLEMDFADVDYISSKCLRILLSLSRRLQGKKLSIFNVNTTVAEIFRLSGLSKMFDIR